MKRLVAMALGLVLMVASLPAHAQEQRDTIGKTQLKVGDAAPDFTLLSNQWEPVKLSDFRGKKKVILAFYVLAFTSG